MAKERLKSPRARLFIALDLPEDVRAALAAWQRSALDDPALRPVRAEALHMTLAFLGYLPERRIDDVTAVLEGTAATAVRIELRPEPVSVPRGRPRLFAIDAVSESASTVQADLSDRLAAAGLYEPEKRPFWPHLTVARVKPAARGKRRPADVKRAPDRLPQGLEQPFDAVRLSLYRSNLRPQGAEYVFLANVELPPRGGWRR